MSRKYSNFLYDIETIKSFDEKNDYLVSTNESDDSKFEECFTKIFSESQILGLNKEKDLDSFLPETPTLSCNLFNSRENKDNILDKSQEKDVKMVEANSNELSSIVDSDKSIISEQTFSGIKSLVNGPKESDNILNSEGKIEDSIYKSDANKKINLFKTFCPKDYLIFHCGDYNKYAREKIDKVLVELCQNSIEFEEWPINSGNRRKNTKKIQNVQKRKENADNIRKKIKSRFLKVLRNTVNEKLKLAGSKKFFKFLPQVFICNVSKEKNKSVLHLSFKDLFSKNFYEEDEKANKSDLVNCYHNVSVLEYLEKNQEISVKSGFAQFKNMSFYKIYKEYLKSKEFEMEIAGLKSQKESDKYINNYIIKAGGLIDFFCN